MVYAHQHNITKSIHTSNSKDSHSTAKQSFKEKCQLCDSMHHSHMELLTNAYYTHFNSAEQSFTAVSYNFKNIGLILSPGRAPPVIS
jgi:hypothetical protein